MPFRASTFTLVSASAVTTSVVTVPAGAQAGDVVFAFVGTAAATPVTVTPPAGWTQVGSLYQPTAFMASGVWTRTITNASEAGGTATWTWSAAARTWASAEAYYGVDTARSPLVNVKQGLPDTAGPTTTPALVLPSSDWLKTYAVARQSPGTDDPKSWSITPGDTVRGAGYNTQAGTGQKLVVAAWDSTGPVTAAPGGTVQVSSSIGPQAPPTNTYNTAVTSPRTFRWGATMKKDELEYWRPKLAGLDWMRVFPDSDGLPPDWSDPRIQFCRDFNAEPFLSSKIDGVVADLTTLSTYLEAMPDWILKHPDPGFRLWITDRHEPEGDVTAAAYKTNSGKFFDMIEDLPGNILARIEYGHVLTRQWTENASGRTYATHDTGRGTYFGVDMYANSWGSPASAVATSFPNAVTFLSRFKSYQFNGGDHRKRVMPELGGVGVPNDTTGTVRAQWITDLLAEMRTWTYAAQGWDFAGACWWNAEGKSGTSLTGAGTKRWFQFDRRHTGTDGSYATIPSVAAPNSGSGGGGSTATERQVSTSLPVSTSHVWSVSVPMATTAPVDPATVNAWSHLGLPQR